MFWKKQKEISSLDKNKYEFYKNHRDYLIAEKHNMEHKYSELLIYLNSGIFIASSVLVSFMKDTIQYKSLIVIGWLFASLNLVFLLLSFIFSINSFKEFIELWDDKMRQTTDSCNMKIMKFLIGISTLFTIMAIMVALIFFSLNFLFYVK